MNWSKPSTVVVLYALVGKEDEKDEKYEIIGG